MQSFPHELWLHILGFLYGDKDPLKACSLACSQMRDISQSILFRSVDVSIIHERLRRQLSDLIIICSAAAFEEFASLPLFRLVKYLAITIEFGSDNADVSMIFNALNNSSSPTLVTLELTCHTLCPSIVFNSAAYPSVHQLGISTLIFATTAQFWAMLKLFPGVQKLTLSNLQARDLDGPAPLSPPHQPNEVIVDQLHWPDTRLFLLALLRSNPGFITRVVADELDRIYRMDSYGSGGLLPDPGFYHSLLATSVDVSVTFTLELPPRYLDGYTSIANIPGIRYFDLNIARCSPWSYDDLIVALDWAKFSLKGRLRNVSARFYEAPNFDCDWDQVAANLVSLGAQSVELNICLAYIPPTLEADVLASAGYLAAVKAVSSPGIHGQVELVRWHAMPRRPVMA